MALPPGATILSGSQSIEDMGELLIHRRVPRILVVDDNPDMVELMSELLKSLVQLNAEQAVVIRGDEAGAYKNIVGVLNICSEAGITNIAFATAK